jgi:3-oxoadipate enol-lactonase
MPVLEMSGGLSLNLVRTGPRGLPPVLFLHAVGLDLTWWDHQFPALRQDHDIVAFDLPGHGLSARLKGALTFEALASVAAEVITRLDAGPAHVVGLSVGGMIAQTLALVRPDLVFSLTLVATVCTFDDPVREALRERARLARNDGMAVIAPLTQKRWFPPAFRQQRPDILDRAAKSLLSNDPGVHAAMWEMIATLDLEARLPAIACSTLVVAGTEDVNAPVAAGQRIADLIPGGSLHALPRVGHFPPIEAPALFNELLRAHLNGV